MRKRLFTLAYVVLVLGGGALLATLDGRSESTPAWLSGWLAYSLLLGAAGVSLGGVLRQVRADRSARWAAWMAFLLRLGVGLALIWLLPRFGYADNEASQSGYLFKDAARRDEQAWALASSDAPLWSAFSGDFSGDQYGGLLALSAGVYRYLSPTTHRPLLIVLLAGWAMGVGVALLWAAARRWFEGDDFARRLIPPTAAWVMALYPEGVLLGASQMREPFAIAAIAACFYGLVEVSRRADGLPHPQPLSQGERGADAPHPQGAVPKGQDLRIIPVGAGLRPAPTPTRGDIVPRSRSFWKAPGRPSPKGGGIKTHHGWFALVVGLAALFMLQPPAALAALLVLGGLWGVDMVSRRRFAWRTLLLLGGALILALVLSTLLWRRLPGLQDERGAGVILTWLVNNFGFQSHLSERASGMVQSMIQTLGEAWTLPLVLVYGFAQPVLPAVLVEPSLPLWMAINTLRALGWYLLAPFLIYGLVTAFHAVHEVPLKAQRIWLSLAALAWIMIAAANAGGDQWDNPRYRTIFLPWLALLAAWALWWALKRQDRWLWRWIAVEVVFVLFFLWWYISRYYPGILHLSIWVTSGLTLGLAAAILLGGWLWDRRKRSK